MALVTTFLFRPSKMGLTSDFSNNVTENERHKDKGLDWPNSEHPSCFHIHILFRNIFAWCKKMKKTFTNWKEVEKLTF